MAPAGRFGAAALREEDFVRFSDWVWITRLRSIAAILALVVVLRWTVPGSVDPVLIAAVCLGDLAPSLLYSAWLRRRTRLRLLAYVQLTVDLCAIFVGLSFIRQSPVLFHFIPLLVVVPASMIEWQCGLFQAVLATVGHFVLLRLSGTAELVSVAGLLPPASFFMIAGQSVFYARHLGQKNAELAAVAASLNEVNVRLEEEAAVSGALLRAAQTLITSLDPGDILQRLNEVVREALHCDWSATLLRDEQRDLYRVAAVSGTQPDILEEVRTFEFSPVQVPLFAAMARDGLVTVDDRSSPLVPAALLERWQISSLMCADLRRGATSVGALAAGFNQRSGAFSQRELRLFGSIAQQAAVALENARLVDSLRAASRLKSEFIGTMSHELRSPLNVVIGYVDLLLDGDMGEISREQHEALERVRQHALQLLELIQETLDVNRLEAGLLPVDLETFPVAEFLEDVRQSIPADWEKPAVRLDWRVDTAPIVIRSDRGKLKKVLRNLVHNALKFTDAGTVSVTVSVENGWVDFAVSDTGIGISPDAVPVIFDMFRQVDRSNTRRYGGVGLGLYIVKQLVRGLGGDISVTSQPGAGSTFRVRLRRGD